MGIELKHKQLCLMRHGDTGLSGRFIGSTDVSLTEAGILESQQAGRVIDKFEIQKVVCSPMLRCRQTADELTLPCTVEYNSLIKEVDFGSWETKCFDEIADEHKSLIDSWIADYHNFSFPDGESIAQFVSRLSDVLELIEKSAEEKILLITHGGVIRHLLCLLLSLPLERYVSFDIKTARCCTLDMFDGGALLTGLNL